MQNNPETILVNADAERSIIGSMLLDAGCVRRLGQLTDDDFAIHANRLIIRAIRAVAARGEPVDLVTVTSELGVQGTLGDAGGVLYLTELSRYVPTTANIDAYVKLAKEASGRRAICRKTEEIGRMARDEGASFGQLMREIETWLSALRGGAVTDEDESLSTALIDVMKILEERTQGIGLGTLTGLAPLDQLTGGLHGGEVTVLAGRPGTGKTAFGLHIAQMFAKEKKPVQVFSLEMSREALAMRLLSSESGVSQQAMRTGGLSEADWEAIADAASRLYGAPIWFDVRSPTPSLIRAKCQRRKDTDGLGLVVIDYLQLIEGDGRYANTNERLAAISREVRKFTNEFNVPVLVLCQLNREIEKRASGRPVLSDLKDSGAIEQDANNAIVLWEPTEDVPHDLLRYILSEGRRYIRAELLKQRNGPVGHADFVFDSERMRFVDLPFTGKQ